MSIRTLFNVIIKILGILFIQNVLTFVAYTYTMFIVYTHQTKTWDMFDIFFGCVIGLLVYILLTYFLIFKTEKVIDILKLDRGFDTEILPLNIHRSTILSISVIVIGGLMVIDNLPELFRQFFIYYKQAKPYGSVNFTFTYAIFSGAKVVIGILLVGFQRPIINLIAHKAKVTETYGQE